MPTHIRFALIASLALLLAACGDDDSAQDVATDTLDVADVLVDAGEDVEEEAEAEIEEEAEADAPAEADGTGDADGDAAPALDLDGESRWDDPAVTDTGAGAITYADMGAYERQP